MKNLIYEKPLLASICINLFFLLSWILMVRCNYIILLPALGIIVGKINKNIVTYGMGLNKKTRVFIYLSLFSVIILAFTCTCYIVINLKN